MVKDNPFLLNASFFNLVPFDSWPDLLRNWAFAKLVSPHGPQISTSSEFHILNLLYCHMSDGISMYCQYSFPVVQWMTENVLLLTHYSAIVLSVT